MALSVNCKSVYAAAPGILLTGECCERASFWGTKIRSSSPLLNCLSEERWSKGRALKPKLQVFAGGLHVKERDIPVGRVKCRTKVRACSFEDKHNRLAAQTDSDDSRMTSPSDGLILFNRDIVKEIVDHLADAPFLQYAYINGGARTPVRHHLSSQFFEKPEAWGPIKRLISKDSPDGVILVRRLGLIDDLKDEPKYKSEYEERTCKELCLDRSIEEYWGVFLHGYKIHQEECYLLKTTRMLSFMGIVTHFVMIEAESFSSSISSQFVNVWARRHLGQLIE